MVLKNVSDNFSGVSAAPGACWCGPGSSVFHYFTFILFIEGQSLNPSVLSGGWDFWWLLAGNPILHLVLISCGGYQFCSIGIEEDV